MVARSFSALSSLLVLVLTSIFLSAWRSNRSYGRLLHSPTRTPFVVVASLKQRCPPSSAAAAQLQPTRLLPKVSWFGETCPLPSFAPPEEAREGTLAQHCRNPRISHMATQISTHVRKRSWPPFAMNSPLRMPRNS